MIWKLDQNVSLFRVYRVCIIAFEHYTSSQHHRLNLLLLGGYIFLLFLKSSTTHNAWIAMNFWYILWKTWCTREWEKTWIPLETVSGLSWRCGANCEKNQQKLTTTENLLLEFAKAQRKHLNTVNNKDSKHCRWSDFNLYTRKNSQTHTKGNKKVALFKSFVFWGRFFFMLDLICLM
jgi:hypothetical protein